MDPKLIFLQKYLPRAILFALTPETVDATPQGVLQDDSIIIYKFPFRVGRESRVIKLDGRVERVERPKTDGSEANNDLYLVDRGIRMNISREHFLIEWRDNDYFLVDRGSACGTKVKGVNVGGEDSGGAIRLKDGDVISVGAKGTPYVFKFITFDEFEVVEK